MTILCLTSKSRISSLDFCSGGEGHTPGETINEMLLMNNYTINDLAYRAVAFYASVSVPPKDFASCRVLRELTISLFLTCSTARILSRTDS